MDKKILAILLLLVVSIYLSGLYFINQPGEQETEGMGEVNIIEMVDAAKSKLKVKGKYDCCLSGEECTYCLIKHGECDCLYEMMNGEESCGECLGEWIEGEGHACPMMAYGFQKAYPEIWKLIKDKYVGKALGPCPMMRA